MTPNIGIINIMPKAHEYVPYLLDTFCTEHRHVKPVWIRLATHGYSSTPEHHMEHYRTWKDVRPEAFDGLVLTGAPVEHLPFASVTYWSELNNIIDDAERHGIPVLGICWGGMVAAHRMGVAPVVYDRKCFGVFEAVSHGVNVSGNLDGRFQCAQSRFAGLDPSSLKRAVMAGNARLIAEGPACGPFIVESSNRMLLAHLGHMEYPAQRIAEEYYRDLEAGRKDVDRPHGMDPESPHMTWLPHRRAFVERWMETLEMARTAKRGSAEVVQ